MQKKEPTNQRSQGAPSSRKRDPPNSRASRPPQAPSMPQPPAPQTPEEWRAHWEAQGQPWRTEPEIDAQRQAELATRRAIIPNVEKGTYPFSEVKLSRADIEWLLATHENGRGPVDWSDESQREREGLDLRGVDLSGSGKQRANLGGLPLARLVGGLRLDEQLNATEEEEKYASVILTGAFLYQAQLEGAELNRVQLERANLGGAKLERANLSRAQLNGANLREARLEGAYLGDAQLEGADLTSVQSEGANFSHAQLKIAFFYHAQLKGANLIGTQLEEANLQGAQLEGVDLTTAQLEGVNLGDAQLKRARLLGARLKRADLRRAQLGEANLSGAQLEGANLNDILIGNKNHIGPRLVDIQWGTVNLAVIDWSQVVHLGDEYEARQKIGSDGNRKGKGARFYEYKTAARANRQLSVVLQGQGLNEDAARFAYLAQVLQKATYWFRMIQEGLSLRERVRALGSWLFSWFVFLLAGYGYKPLRSFLAYLLVIAGFATAYYLLGLPDLVGPHDIPGPHYLSWYEAFVVSMTAFHGRGFFVGTFSPGDPQALVAAIEAFLGLLIEVTFIATLTQRLFSR